MRLDRTLVIGERPQILLRAPLGWRARALCFGLVGDPMLFVQSRDKDALVLVLDSCAVNADRCAADLYFEQTAGAQAIQWGAETHGEIGEERAAVTIVPGAGRLGREPARFWQLLLYEAAAPSRARRQVLVALASRASAERQGELAATVASLRLEPRGGRDSISSECRNSPFARAVRSSP